MKNKFQQQRGLTTFVMYSFIKPVKLSSGCTALHICDLSHTIEGSGQSMPTNTLHPCFWSMESKALERRGTGSHVFHMWSSEAAGYSTEAHK